MDKIDLKKIMANLYGPGSRTTQIVDVPKMNFVMVDGRGSPDDPEYAEAIQLLYSISYTLKFMIKKINGIDYGVMPLEGLWWADKMQDFLEHNKKNWQWTALIMQPDFISEEFFNEAVQTVKKLKNPANLGKARFRSFEEGICAQILYIGPYSDEGPTIQTIHQFIQEKGHTLSGKHHEIYLSDPRRTDPKKLKTVIRQPFKSS